MTAEGKLKQTGIPENTKHDMPDDSRKDSIRQEMQRKLDSLDETGNEEEDIQQEEKQTTQVKKIGGEVAIPMAVPFVPTIF